MISADGDKVGSVKEIFVDEATGQITHFLVSKGILFKEEKLVPAWWIERLSDTSARLAVDADLLDRLPDYQSEHV